MDKSCVFISYNCRSVMRSVDCIRAMCADADIIALQETWLLPHDISFLGTIDQGFSYTGSSAVDTSAGPLRGRPYGGVAILWKKSVFQDVTVVQCNNVRISAIKITLAGQRSLVVFSVYMPTECAENLVEFTECMSEISAIIESVNAESVYILGDFNAHPGEDFSKHLMDFCCEQDWICADFETLGLHSGTFTYVSDVHGSRRWLDHCLVTQAAWATVTNVCVRHGVYWSDHYPLEVHSNINLIKPKCLNSNVQPNNKVTWGQRDNNQIEYYNSRCQTLLCKIELPGELTNCYDKLCDNSDHRLVIDTLYNNLINILRKSSIESFESAKGKNRRRAHVVGWNKHVKHTHREARLAYHTWLMYGRPSNGLVYQHMAETRKVFKSKLKWCQNNQNQIKMDILATHHVSKNFTSFWKQTKKLSPLSGLPVSVSGVSEPQCIANVFMEHFKVEPSLTTKHVQVLNIEVQTSDFHVKVDNDEVKKIIRNMRRGKSPGHDGLSIEHLQHAGAHLPRVLTMLFNLCIGHSYLPEELMKTIVVPIIKNKTGDASDVSNYRPISLATVVAKVLDSILDKHLMKHLNIRDEQFGFKPGLSTETAILCLKHTVQYYTSKKTPIYACFLDLSKAFDLVSYDILWDKLVKDTTMPGDLINVFKFWYLNQKNMVKWSGSHSEEYKLKCGVRQGGITSPKLFNLYMNQLIGELSRTKIGCSIHGHSINNISYADDMVLLSPSISALRRLIEVCETYAAAHGLRYNVKKSELLLFKAGTKSYSVPPVSLYDAPLTWVKQFKYLGHWVTEDMSDNVDIERERRALSVRCNMVARRFARCTTPVKVTLFKAYCASFYTCSLWARYTQKAYNALRVQYNNGFRMLLGLPRYCSASGMFADKRVDGFHAIMRKRVASLVGRMRRSSNSLLAAVAQDLRSTIMGYWLMMLKPVSSMVAQ